MTQTERLARIAELEKQKAAIDLELYRLRCECTRFKSRQFIDAHGITKKDVFDTTEVYEIGHFQRLKDYIEKHKIQKRFTTWNGVLFFTGEVLQGKYIETDGRYEHVPESNK